MSKRTIEIITCDMCGAEIDVQSDDTKRMSVISGGYYGMPVHDYNPTYGDGLQKSIQSTTIDLCPTCADRACVIHRELVLTDNGRSSHYVYSWRDGE